MRQGHDIVLAVDYHDANVVIRRFNEATGEEKVLKEETSVAGIERVLASAETAASATGGRVVWVMESTTGWARVKATLGSRATLVLANVLQMPLPPKARRRKTDKIDTRRLLREYRNGELPTAYQPPEALRVARRLVSLRESLKSRQTALSNWLDRYRAHETWASGANPRTARGQAWWRGFAETRDELDGFVILTKLDELEHVQACLEKTQAEMLTLYAHWPEAQAIDAIYGIAEVSAVSILARIGPVERFDSAEQLIAFAGLAPGVRQSDRTRHAGKIGGGGTDKHLRHYVIEATIWARRIPRYRQAYLRTRSRRGKKIARLVVGRLLLRSLHKMLRDGVAFDAQPAA